MYHFRNPVAEIVPPPNGTVTTIGASAIPRSPSGNIPLELHRSHRTGCATPEPPTWKNELNQTYVPGVAEGQPGWPRVPLSPAEPFQTCGCTASLALFTRGM